MCVVDWFGLSLLKENIHMRIKITIEHLPEQQLPLNYQYLISSWIYKVLHESDADFASWLHEQGYTLNGKSYKHFCFSMLRPKRYHIHSKEKVFELVEGPTDLILSFNIDKAVKDMVKGLFQNNMIQWTSGSFNLLGMVTQVQLLAAPEFRATMGFRTLTPICISVGNEESKHAEYLSPTDERYAQAFAKNLVDKANAYLDTEMYSVAQVQFRLLSEKPKDKLWTIKGTEVKGYLFDFELSAPPELIAIGYYGGFGVQNSALGMGVCEILNNNI